MNARAGIAMLIATTRGTTIDAILSTPRTLIASSSSRIFRAPRSAVTALPTTPAKIIAVIHVAISRLQMM